MLIRSLTRPSGFGSQYRKSHSNVDPRGTLVGLDKFSETATCQTDGKDEDAIRSLTRPSVSVSAHLLTRNLYRMSHARHTTCVWCVTHQLGRQGVALVLPDLVSLSQTNHYTSSLYVGPTP